MMQQDVSPQNFDEVQVKLQAEIDNAQAAGDTRLEAQLTGFQGNLYLEGKKMDLAYKCFEKVLDIAVCNDDGLLESDALGSMGLVHLDTGDPAMAIEKLKAALQIADSHEDRRRRMNHLGGLGNTYLTIAADDQAIQYFEQAYDLSVELGDESAQAGFLNNIALIKKNINDHDEAVKLYEQVRNLTRKTCDLLGERNALRHLINLYSEAHQNNDLVLVYLQRAIDLSQQLDDYTAEVTYYDAKILVLLALNRYSEALDLMDTALQDPRLSEFSERKMQLFVNRGNACFDENKIEQAFNAYSKALEISVRLQNWNVEARMLGRLGAIQAELDNFEVAIDYATQSLKKAKKVEDQRLVGEQYCMLALANRDLGNYSAAIEYCEKALEVFNTATANPLKEKILNLLEDLRAEPVLSRHEQS